MTYLSVYKQDQLDIPTKSFEVAYRSYVAQHILAAYPEKTALQTALQKQVDVLDQSTAVMSGQIKGIISDNLAGKKWEAFWENLQFMECCSLAQRHVESHDVLYLSLSVTLTFSFRDLFLDIIKEFPDVTDYIRKATSYREVRNALSHRGSRLISSEQADEAVDFMRRAKNAIGDKFFWYKPWNEISNDIDKYMSSSKPFIAENIDEIPFSESEIVCREQEISSLFKYICNWDGLRKVRNSKHLVCIAGYGGIGKTALVTEFIKRLISQLATESFEGLRPDFILFFTAKEEKLEYDPHTGKLVSHRVNKQFSSFEELKNKVYSQLKINEFADDWNYSGILVIDNLETLDAENRKKLVDFIYYDVPSCIRVIITTRIPEEADELIKLRGFQAEEGLVFIREYIEKNNLDVVLSDSEINNLVANSYGNPLVLVLALKRLSTKVITYGSLIRELKQLPNNANRSVSSFMYQNTIEEIMHNHPDRKEAIHRVLQSMSVYDGPLNKEVLATANKLDVENVEDILDILAKYLVIERIGDSYVINSFANEFILVSMSADTTTKISIRNGIWAAVNESTRNKETLNDYLKNYDKLKSVISDWQGDSDKECFAIAKAFVLYEDRSRITPANADFEIQQICDEFELLIKQNSAHPYVYYQRARILKELRRLGLVEDEYNAQIEDDFDRCLILINDRSFRAIQNTRTFPSILWIFSQFLLDVGKLQKAALNIEQAVQVFRNLGDTSHNYYDALAVQGIVEIKLYVTNMLQKSHLKIARSNYAEIVERRLKKAGNLDPINEFEKHVNTLKQELNKYEQIKIR